MGIVTGSKLGVMFIRRVKTAKVTDRDQRKTDSVLTAFVSVAYADHNNMQYATIKLKIQNEQPLKTGERVCRT